MSKFNSILREIFSGANGKLSAKRVIGGVAMAVALGCTIALVIRDGSNNVVENLLMTIFITSVSLLGLPAITGVWGSSKININKTEETERMDATINVNETPQSISIENKQPIKEEPVIPNCEDCKYKKKKGTK